MTPSAPKTTFFQRHLGRRGGWILLGAVCFGVALAFLIMRFVGPLPWAGHEFQANYPIRVGQIQWQPATYDDPAVARIVGLGGEGENWSSSLQVKALSCWGLDVDTVIMINTLSQATLPQGWLSQKDMPVPVPVRRARQALGSMIEELRIQPRQSCQMDASWQEEGAAEWIVEKPDTHAGRAREILKQAAHDAGLAQLVLSPELLSGEQMERVARLLDEAGKRLALATGRDSKGLLGLNGRVALTMMSTDATQRQAGRTRAVNVEQYGPFIEVLVEDELRVIMHEWFHSLDLVLAPVIFGHGFPGLSWFDQSSRINSSVRLEQLHEKMKQPLAAYSKMRHWQESQKKQDNAKYWTSQGEAMAYAFEFWASDNLHDVPCDIGGRRERPLPRLEEAACIAHSFNDSWDELLDQLLTES